MIMLAIASVIVAYLLGSISFAVIFSKLFSHVDVRSQGSGNAGTTNVLRVSGVKAGVLTLLCDALKGTASCLIGMLAFKVAFGADNSVVVLCGEYLCGLLRCLSAPSSLNRQSNPYLQRVPCRSSHSQRQTNSLHR